MLLSGRTRVAGLILLFSGIGSALPANDAGPNLQLASGQELEIQRFAGLGKSLLLWLPSERGFRPAHREHARALAQLGYEVWLADLHDAYFVERNRRSIANFPLDDVVDIIDAAVSASKAGVFLMSASRGAQLSLIAAREWQQQNPGKAGLKGVFLAHAHLYRARPAAGESASYLPIVSATNLPVYLLDTQYSTRSARIGELAEALESGGSRVFTQVIKGVQGGFIVRADSELEHRDQTAKRDFARIVERGLRALALVPAPTAAAATSVDTRQYSRNGAHATALSALPKPLPAPPLRLDGYHGQGYSLERQEGRVVLVNFWASWCKPCVEEIPSLHRLRQAIQNPDFDIFTVNVGESRQRIDRFLSRVKLELPLLLDTDSSAAMAWKIYVYPSSYLVDHNGQIRYAYLGALEWDSPENIAIIQNLLRQR
ncbi:MAG: TlpA family protein disulfide reductase [Gammaproteobacteria bacterium]|nr:MAG: TlpA family protein disulfide reductase [Gammaproteobacteria bacterium]